jgi:hypothetical protein
VSQRLHLAGDLLECGHGEVMFAAKMMVETSLASPALVQKIARTNGLIAALAHQFFCRLH